MTLTDRLPGAADPDTVFDAFSSWVEEQGLTLYPHQEEALIEVATGANVILVELVAGVVGPAQGARPGDGDEARPAAPVGRVGAVAGRAAGDEEGVGLPDPAPLRAGQFGPG